MIDRLRTRDSREIEELNDGERIIVASEIWGRGKNQYGVQKIEYCD